PAPSGIRYDGGIRAKCVASELGKLNLRLEESTILEVQGKMCLMCMSQENSTHTKRNPL
ncbi:hypothetical protein BHE74_00047760, partial [Ensete ventricosum]